MIRVALLILASTGCHLVFELDDANLGWSAPEPVALAGWSWTDDDKHPSLAGDQLELYFTRNDFIVRSSRTKLDLPWPAPLGIPELGAGVRRDSTPEVAAGGLVMYFASDRGTTPLEFNIFRATRLARGGPWDAARVDELLSPEAYTSPSVDAENLSMVITSSTETGSFDLYLSERESTTGLWPTPVPLVTVNSDAEDRAGFLSASGMSLYFVSTRAGSADLWMSRRASKEAPFGEPAPLTEINSSLADEDPWVSPDETELYFITDRTTTTALWRSTR